MEAILEIVSSSMMLFGAFFMFTGAVGLFRMPDFFTRTHPAGMNDSIGLPLILIGLLLHVEIGLISVKIIILLLFSIVTSATASHALAQAALVSGLEPVLKDDLEEDICGKS